MEQEGAARVLEENVVAGVAEGELLAGLLGEIVADVFGLPKAVGDAEVVELAQGGVVVLHRLVGRLEIKLPHGEGFTLKPGWLSAKLHERCSAASGLRKMG